MLFLDQRESACQDRLKTELNRSAESMLPAPLLDKGKHVQKFGNDGKFHRVLQIRKYSSRFATRTARTQGTGLGQLALTWAQLEPNWGPTWRNLGMCRCCYHVRSKGCIRTMLCRHAKCANFHSGEPTFGALSRSNMATPPS